MEKCPTCNREYERIGTHWRFKPDHRPEFSDKQIEILKGSIASDGTLHGRSDKNCYALVVMTNKKYLDYLNSEFGCLGKDVSLRQTAEESAQAIRDSGFRPDADAKDYKNVYKWSTRSHPEIDRFESWYQGSHKIIPASVELTPLMLKHWYVGDGNLNTKGNHFRCNITLSNQRNNREVINKLFKSENLPDPIWRERSGENKKTTICWNKEASREILEYMGRAPPGFEYKWPNQIF